MTGSKKQWKPCHAMIFILVLAVLNWVPSSPAFAGNNNEKGVRAAHEQFYAALNSMFKGALEPMENVWSHAKDVTYMGPDGGWATGWDDVLANWKKQADRKLGGKVSAANTQITLGKELSVVQCYEKGQNVDASGKPLPVSIRATNVFRLEGGKWKMIGHHTDILPSLEKH